MTSESNAAPTLSFPFHERKSMHTSRTLVRSIPTIAIAMWIGASVDAQTPAETDRTVVELLSKDRYVAGKQGIPVRELDSGDLERLRDSMSATLRRPVTIDEARAAGASALSQARASGKNWKMATSLRKVPNEGTGRIGNFVDARLNRWLEVDYPGLDSRLTLPRSQSSDATVRLPGAAVPLVAAQGKVSKSPSRAFSGGIDDLVAFGGNGLSGQGTAFEMYVTQETIDWVAAKGHVDERGLLRKEQSRSRIEARREKLAAGMGPNAQRARASDIDRLLSRESRIRFASLGTYESLRFAAEESRRAAQSLAKELTSAEHRHGSSAPFRQPAVGRVGLRGLALYEFSGAAARLFDAATGTDRLSALEWSGAGIDVLAGCAAGLDAVAASGSGWARPLTGSAGRAVPVLLLAGEGIQLLRLANGELTPAEYGTHLATTGVALTGASVGGWAFGTAGGFVGSSFGPGGTAVGIFVGEVVGGWVGAEASVYLWYMLDGDKSAGIYYYDDQP